MTPVEIISAVSLSTVAVLAGIAIFCHNYHENWLQFVGLIGITVWAAARAMQIADVSEVGLPWRGLTLHVALAAYAIGTAWKVWCHRPPKTTKAPPGNSVGGSLFSCIWEATKRAKRAGSYKG